MWYAFKYVVDDVNDEKTELADSVEETIMILRSNETLNAIKQEINENAENYVISLHYLDFPIVIIYSPTSFRDTEHLKTIHEYFEPFKEVRKILLMDKADEIKGFYFLCNQIRVQKQILSSLDQYTFDKRASESGFETYIINDLRTIWKNRRFETLQRSLVQTDIQYNKPNKNHPLYKAFVKYLVDIYRNGVDRFKTFICIGDTKIGKSVFFSKFIVPEQYYIYHSNFLEFSKMSNQPMKIFRIMDDINWDDVEPTLLKSLLNRNISSVNIKYGYEFIFPLIPIIVINKEDYENFRKRYSDIWEFLTQNTVIYPEQKNREVVQETEPLFLTDELADESDEMYLFNEILPISELAKCDENNINKFIKKRLNETQSWKYDTKKYIQLPDFSERYIPNPELNRKTILRQYDDYLLRKKQEQISREQSQEKKHKETKDNREPWYKKFSERLKEANRDRVDKLNKNIKKSNKYDDLDDDGYEDEDYDDDNDSYEEDEDEDDEDDEDYDDDDMSSEEGYSNNNGFINM